ncbi:hypothetical protein [Mucilaginibacter flavus]|uniref:hypothetical protein n=1 Tax=Mucilaginibacter flavus TaxID=931504 RepID=UPI0025B3B2FE|nr:hypothetical protein [Mucilaginibacter flavus]MDN3584818.1 hypothetical protein [Mucilaginibacter flavus]
MNWNSIVIIVCILLAAFAVWKEYARVNKTRLAWRVVAVLLAVVALSCIALPLTYQKDIIKQDKNEVILLTPGYSVDSLSKYPTDKTFTLQEAIKKENAKAILLNNADELAADSTITQVCVLGDGLDKDELAKLNGLPVVFYPTPSKQGISAINWNQNLKAGDALIVQGNFKNTSAKKVKLILKGLSTGLDSMEVNNTGNNPFQLSTIPKSTGKNIFYLLAITGKDTIENEQLPIQIEPVKPLKVLMLTASPDFESRFLKNWLSQNGYGVVVRSAISKDKFNKEFINIDQFSIDHLSQATLSKFDVLIGDLTVLKTLNSSEASALQQEVTQKGLGVIVKGDSTNHSTSWLQRDFPTDRLAIKDPAPVSLVLQGQLNKSNKLNVGPVYIKSQSNTQNLVSDEHGHALANITLAGSGKLIFTPLNNTFSWMLNGYKSDYTNLWSLLIGKAARRAPVMENWDMLSSIPTISKPVQLQLQSAATPSGIKIGDALVSPTQHNLLPFEWQTNYWPQISGWQSAQQAGGALNWFYVYGEQDWPVIRALSKQMATKNYVDQNHIDSRVTKQIHEKSTIAVSKIYFYVLLLIACVFLWVEAKFL